MKPKPENEELLDDVFSQASCEELRNAMFSETLRLVRSRRRWCQARNTTALATAVVLAGLMGQLLLHRSVRPVPPSSAASRVAQAYTLVRSQPLPESALVETVSLQTGLAVASVTRIETVRTTAHNYRLINDEQLLALLAPQSAVLIREGPDSEKLIFANPADQDGVPDN
jgi:hypothetical protein